MTGYAAGPILLEKLGEWFFAVQDHSAPLTAVEENQRPTTADTLEARRPDIPPPSTQVFRLELVESAVRTEIETADAAPIEATELPGPTWLRWLLLALSPLLALFAARWWHAIAEYQADIDASTQRAEAARNLAHATSTVLGVPYHIERMPPFDLAKADDAATILSRLAHGEAGHELDVLPTIDHTIAAGGRLEPVYARGGRREVLIVFVDTETGGHPFLDGVEQVLARWRRGGLVVDRFDYGRVPTRLRRWPDGRAVDLVQLARRSEGRPLLIFSRMASAREYSGDLGWLRTLRAWPVRAWFDLDPRTPEERPNPMLLARLAATGLRRFPWTGDDLVLCARYLAPHGEGVHARSERPVPASDPDILWMWAACAALIPDPSWPQLDAVRRALPELRAALPDARCVQHLIDWARQTGLGEDGREYLLGEGDRLVFDRQRRTGLIARLRRWDAENFPQRRDRLEYRARELLMRQLDTADTRDDALGEQLRRVKTAFHRAAMHPEEAEQLLREFADQAGARELKDLVTEELSLQDDGHALAGVWAPGTRDAMVAWTTGAPRARLADLIRLRAWGWRGVARAWPWMAAGVASSTLWWFGESGQLDILPHPGAPISEARTMQVVQVPATWKVVQVDAPTTTCSQPELTALADTAPMCFVALEAGEFLMGSPQSEPNRDSDEVQHIARVGNFIIGTHEVTLGQWRAIMGAAPEGCEMPCVDDDLPASPISWSQACEFMNALTLRENSVLHARGEPALTQCYIETDDTWKWLDHACTGFRLPTETEWEYAARAGTNSAYHWGENLDDACRFANINDVDTDSILGGRLARPHCEDGYSGLSPVGRFSANNWGLHDMAGNVSEWVWDSYVEGYPTEASELNYSGPLSHHGDSVQRGGSCCAFFTNSMRSADRLSVFRKSRSASLSNTGFRCVRAIWLAEPSFTTSNTDLQASD